MGYQINDTPFLYSLFAKAYLIVTLN
jgi:hypothetical protein